MSLPDKAIAALHSCGKVVAAHAYRSDNPRERTRAEVDARAWERRGDEIVETDVGGVHAIGWCDCTDRGYPSSSSSTHDEGLNAPYS